LFFNGDVPYVPRWASDLIALTKSAEKQAEYLDWAVRTGFNGVRVFAGALTWAGQTPASALAGLPAFLDRAYARGLAVEVTALTDTGTGYDMAAHVDAIGAICAGRQNVVVEVGNEIGHGSQSLALTLDYARQLGETLLTPRGILWAVGAPIETDEPIDGVYPGAGGDYCTVHLDRGRETWNQVRRVREIYAVVEAHSCPAINNEPIGADENYVAGKRWNDPAMFFTLGALDRAFGTGGVHHSQAGLMAELPGPLQQQCADKYVAAHRAVDAVLPNLVGSYKNVGHGGSPLSSATFVDGGDGDGVVRAYSFISGTRGVTVLIGAKGNLGLVWANGWTRVGSAPIASITAHDGRVAAVWEIRRTE
jgi:hypothetical protein